MPRQIPLRRARGGEDDVVEGCAATYLKGIVAIIALILVMGFCGGAIDIISMITAPMVFIIIGIALVGIAIQERAQIASWAVTIENQIEQWTHDDKRFVIVVAFFSVLICLILAILGIVALRKL